MNDIPSGSKPWSYYKNWQYNNDKRRYHWQQEVGTLKLFCECSYKWNKGKKPSHHSSLTSEVEEKRLIFFLSVIQVSYKFRNCIMIMSCRYCTNNIIFYKLRKTLAKAAQTGPRTKLSSISFDHRYYASSDSSPYDRRQILLRISPRCRRRKNYTHFSA